MSADLASCHNVERLLLHSCTSESRSSQERVDLDYKLVVNAPLLSATITDLCNEPLFFNSYLSDEEDESSSEADNMSFSTGTSHSLRDDDFLDDFDATLPELLAEECNFVEQQCSKAHAVMVVAAGRPKMVQVAKVKVHSAPLLTRSATSPVRLLPRSVSTMNNINLLAPSRHPVRDYRQTSSSSTSSLSSTPDIPSTPNLESGLRTPMSARTPLTPTTPNIRSHFDPFDSPSTYDISATPISRQYYFDRPQMVKRSKTTFPTLGRSSAPLSAPLTAPTVYTYAPKKVARAADERSGIMELPPFPSEAAMPAARPSRPWALRKDSFGSVHQREGSKSSTKSARSMIRKVESAMSLKR